MRWRWHTLLFAVYPVLFLYARNSGNLPGEVLVRPLVAAIVLAVVTLLLARVVVGEWLRGVLLASALVVTWSLYGHVHAVLTGAGGVVAWLGHHRVLLPLWFALVVWLAVILRRGSFGEGRARDLGRAATLVGALLVTFSLVTVVIGVLRGEEGAQSVPFDPRSPFTSLRLTHPEADVYYIVLDGYGRADILRDLYDYDNEPFLDALRERGFCVADSARANYTQTLLSLVATLRGADFQPGNYGLDMEGADRRPLVRQLRRFMHRGCLARVCEWTRAFATGYAATEMLDVEQYLSPAISLNEFERALVAATPLDVVLNLVESRHGDVLHRRVVEFAFANLPVAQDDPPHAFTFAHIVAPHPPFVFAPTAATAGAMVPLADGDHVIGNGGLTVEQYRAAYRAQVAEVNLRTLKAIDAILANGRESIILLHGDHGPGSLLRWDERIPESAAAHERLAILLAVRVSGAEIDLCRHDLTPAGVVRELGAYLGGSRRTPRPIGSYFSTWSRPYDFVEIAPDGTVVVPDEE